VSARDDYPAIAIHSRFPQRDGEECVEALKEIDRLRRWREEAIEVQKGWDEVTDLIRTDGPGNLGRRVSEIVRDEIARLQTVEREWVRDGGMT
jgi:hypothetical protein